MDNNRLCDVLSAGGALVGMLGLEGMLLGLGGALVAVILGVAVALVGITQRD